MVQKKVLVTGMSGLIGGLVRERLEGKYTLSALNRRAVPGVECHQADIADLDAIRPAFEGIDVVVHLAAMAQPTGMTWEELLNANIIGCYNVFEASRGRVLSESFSLAAGQPSGIGIGYFPTTQSLKDVTMKFLKHGRKWITKHRRGPGDSMGVPKFSAKRWRGILRTPLISQ